jgi:hypothetical protein
MARMNLMARKHVCVLPCRNVVPMESHSDGQNDDYFPRTLRTVLLALGSSKPPLFNESLRLHRERPTIDCIRRIRKVVEAPAPRWMFKAGMREAAQEALTVL